jgi:hypothetical protein
MVNVHCMYLFLVFMNDFYIHVCFLFDRVLTKKYNKKIMRNNILKEVNCKIEVLLECVVKKQ